MLKFCICIMYQMQNADTTKKLEAEKRLVQEREQSIQVSALSQTTQEDKKIYPIIYIIDLLFLRADYKMMLSSSPTSDWYLKEIWMNVKIKVYS